jgi:hypothetical protein
MERDGNGERDRDTDTDRDTDMDRDINTDSDMKIDINMDSEEIYAEGSDTPLKFVPRGMIACRNLFIGV